MAATPPMWLAADLHTLPLSPLTFGTKFDVVLINPPVQGNQRHSAHQQQGPPGRDVWTWDDVRALRIDSLADAPSFVFLWCGSTAEGVRQGRACIGHWGFRVVDSIAWVKAQRLMAWDGGDAYGGAVQGDGVFASAKVHRVGCLCML